MSRIPGNGSSQRHQHRQNRNLFNGVFEQCHHTKGWNQAEHTHHQPRRSAAVLFNRSAPYRFIPTGTHLLLRILGGFFTNNVNDIVHRDDAQQPIKVIHNWHQDVVVTIERCRNRFLIQFDRK